MAYNGKLVDLFCGCGGFSLGAHLAGFEISLAIDIDEKLSSAYRLNYPNVTVENLDIAKLTNQKFVKLLGNERPLGIVGGPPCQGFSLIGKRDKEDPRNNLVHHYFRLVKAAQPAFFIMENVPGLIIGHGQEILDEALKQLKPHYDILAPFTLDAADYGAATKRKRVIVVGFSKDLEIQVTQQSFAPGKSARPATIKEAFLKIPEPKEADRFANEFGWVKGTYLSDQFVNPTPPTGVGNKEAISLWKKGYYSGLEPTVHTEKVKERFQSTPQGKTEKTSRYPRLKWDEQCGTLRAGTGSDKGSFQAVRPIHPSKPRVVTVREAARIQGFPDWYLFHPTKWHSFRMIGNSVSPILSRSILSDIHFLIDSAGVSNKAKAA